VNQSYDQKVALDDKKSMRQGLAYLRQSNRLVKGTIDGWALIHVALAAVRELSPDSWTYSFNKVNLKPSTRVKFPEWVKRIQHYIQGGESFKPEVVRDAYTLLSPFWHGMQPADKQHAAAIFASHDHHFTVECVKALISDAHVPMPEMQNVRLALELALQDPSQLQRGAPDVTMLAQPAEVQEVQALVESVVTGLRSFELHPKDSNGKPLFAGIALFDHLVSLSRRSVSTGTDLVPSAQLDVEYTNVQQRLINPRPMDYAMHEIAKHAHGEGARTSMAKRKLDNLGYIRGDSGFANDDERRRRLRNQLGLTTSIAAISKQESDLKAATASLESTKLMEAAPAAILKLIEKGGDLTKITMTEMSAIAFKHFKGTSLKGNKTAHAKELGDLIKQQPGVLQLTAATTTTTTTAAATAATVTATATVTAATAVTPSNITSAVPTAPVTLTMVAPIFATTTAAAVTVTAAEWNGSA
jgi:hypothetical protein